MMQLTPAQKRYLVRDHVIGSGLFNAGLNALLGWLTFRAVGRAPLWGNPSIAVDVLSTSFFLPFFVCVISTPLIAFALRRGKAEPVMAHALYESPLGRLPRNVWARAGVLGAIVMVVCAPPTVLMLALSVADAMSVAGYAAFKAGYCALLAGAVSPVVALFAMVPRPEVAIDERP